MTLLDQPEARRPLAGKPVEHPAENTAGQGVPSAPRSADATTVLAIFVVLQLVLPSKLVLNMLPLSLSAASLVALLLGTLWLCSQMTTTLGAAKGRSPVRTSLFGYCAALLAAYANAAVIYLPSDERDSGDHTMVVVFALIFVALATCDGVRSRARLYFLFRVIVVSGAAVALVGILQFLIGFDLTPHLRPPGMHFTSTDAVVLDRSGLRRVSGTTAHPIEFGVLCAMLLPLSIHVASHTEGRGRRPVFWWSCTGLLAAGLMFSVSRSAILAATCVGIVLFLGWSARRRVLMLGIGAAFLVFVQLLSPGLLNVFLNLFRNAGSDPSVSYRTHDYATARELISQHLFFGRGLGTWYAPKHEIFDNQYLLTLVDSGIVGLVAFLSILLAAIYAGIRVLWLCHHSPGRLASPAADRDLALSITAALSVLLPTYATFDFTAFVTVSALLYLLVGVSGAFLRIVQADVASTPADPHAIV